MDRVDDDREPVRVRREPPSFRRARVESVSPRSARMVRLVLGGPELDGFIVDGPASSIRVLLPDDDGVLELPVWTGNEFVAADGDRAVIRTFTPLQVDDHLAIDVVLHDAGRAARWAATARAGDEVAVSGPGRTDPIVAGARAYLLGGDESAIPAIGQLLEALPPTTDVDVRIELARPDARLALPAHPHARVTWLDADPQAEPGDALATSIEQADVLPDAIWLAGEAAAIQRLRRHLFDVRGFSRANVIARGYWKRARQAATDVPAAGPAGTFPP